MIEYLQSGTVNLADWFAVGAVRTNFALNFDYLSTIMALFIVGIDVLVYLYVIFYIKRNNVQPHFFAYLNLFIFFALILVLSDNLPFAFIGWTGIGLCSYVLIGFRGEGAHNSDSNISAKQKALVANVVSDACFILATCIIAIQVGVLNFVEIEESAQVIASPDVEIAIILLVVGAVIKSILLPLCVWLPSAMRMYKLPLVLAHAVIMVAVGAYLLVRMNFLYTQWNFYW